MAVSGRQAANRQLTLNINARDNASPALRRVQTSLQLLAKAFVFRQAGAEIESLGKKMLGLGVGAAALAVQWQKGQLNIRTQTDLTDRQFADFNKRTLDLFATIPQSAQDVQSALYDIFSGTDASYKTALSMVKKFSEAAVAGGTTLDAVTRGAITTMNAFGLTSKDITRILDVQFNMVRFGVGTYDEFVSKLGQLAPAARRAGQTVETMSAMFGIATRLGLNAAQASISVARAMDMLFKTSNAKKLKDALGIDVVDPATGKFKQMNVILEEMHQKFKGMTEPQVRAVFERIFGGGEIRANRFFGVVLPNMLTTDKYFKLITNSGGAFGRAWDKIKNSAQVALDTMRNKLHAIGIAMGQSALPALGKFAAILNKILDWFSRLSPGMKLFLEQLLLFGGVSLTITGKVFRMYGAFLGLRSILKLADIEIGAIMRSMGKWTLIINAVLLLAFLMISHWNQVKGILKALLPVIVAIGVAFAAWGILRLVSGLKLLALALGLDARALELLNIEGFILWIVKARNAVLVFVAAMRLLATTGSLAALSLGGIPLAIAAIVVAALAAKPIMEKVASWLDPPPTHNNAYNKFLDTQSRLDFAINKLGRGYADMTQAEQKWIDLGGTVPREFAGYGVTLAQLQKAHGKLSDAEKYGTDTLKKQAAIANIASQSVTKLKQATNDLAKAGSGDFSTVSRFLAMSGTSYADWNTMVQTALKGGEQGQADFMAKVKGMYMDLKNSIADSLNFVKGALGDLSSKSHLTAGQILKDFDNQLKAMDNYKKNWDEVAHSGIKGAKDFLQNGILPLGQQGQVILQALASGNKTQMAKIIGDWEAGKGKSKDFAGGIMNDLVGALKNLNDTIRTMLGWNLKVDSSSAQANLNALYSDSVKKGFVFVMHQGGMIGEGEKQMRKFHGGGLAEDEIPIIAQRGEGILSRRGMKNLGGKGVLDQLNRYHDGGVVDMGKAIETWDNALRHVGHHIEATVTAQFKRDPKHWEMGFGGGGYRAGNVGHAMYTIRIVESGNNYRAQNPYSSASGAYQYVDGTWNHYGGYARALYAPPSVQDRKAYADVSRILAAFHNNVTLVPQIWHWGWGGYKHHGWDSYDSHWMSIYNRFGGGSQHQLWRGGMLNEPVVGVGARTGETYSFAERGPERIGAGNTYHLHFHDAHPTPQEIIDDLTWWNAHHEWSN